jgi:hypothetical protein
VALAYTYTFKIPVHVQNMGDDRSKAPYSKVTVRLYDASNNQITAAGAPISLYDGDQTVTITLNTGTQATSYSVDMPIVANMTDESKSTLTLPKTNIP